MLATPQSRASALLFFDILIGTNILLPFGMSRGLQATIPPDHTLAQRACLISKSNSGGRGFPSRP